VGDEGDKKRTALDEKKSVLLKDKGVGVGKIRRQNGGLQNPNQRRKLGKFKKAGEGKLIPGAVHRFDGYRGLKQGRKEKRKNYTGLRSLFAQRLVHAGSSYFGGFQNGIPAVRGMGRRSLGAKGTTRD